ncbi:MAG: diguanylate cyclase [Desulfobulbus sp.]|jgi:diguanylate cyclase (GGDEF)-like protein|uniref:diguanylate cyclase n=1 Tax=Desulfobulbus sp. TaxID=895 RepID=UPI00284D8896|nr:diguanylate cyclase [Desulfobulbus sp.]MDR2550659.1 diguanylate cyclase [Desulfobulbus sp.]
MKKRTKTTDNTILVVDDNPLVTTLIAEVLGHAGYAVAVAASGQEALARLETLVPDLILLDIEMPGLSGIETCRIIKKDVRTADTPVFFVTASSYKEDIVAGFAAGGQDYIVKPSTREELLARVRTHLSLCKTQQELKASRARYRKLSFLDDLTGLYNTRYLYKTLQRYLDKYPDRAVTASFLDIDSFKQVVDRHGHLNGSRAIAELAGVIKPLLPRGCYGVSYGGDEFVLILPGRDITAGSRLVRRIREAIAASRFLVAHGLDLGLTVSCGVAAYPENGHTMVDLLGTADHALFEAKRQGKNRVVAYGEMQADGGSGLLPPDRHRANSSVQDVLSAVGAGDLPAHATAGEEQPRAGAHPRRLQRAVK